MWILESNFFLRAVRLKHILLFSALSLCLIESYAQRKIDSLQAVLQTQIPDSSRIKALVDLANLFEYVDVAKSRAYSEEAITLAEHTNLPRLKSIAYKSMASIYRVSGDYSSALRLDNMSLESSLISSDSAMIATAYNNVAHD